MLYKLFDTDLPDSATKLHNQGSAERIESECGSCTCSWWSIPSTEGYSVDHLCPWGIVNCSLMSVYGLHTRLWLNFLVYLADTEWSRQVFRPEVGDLCEVQWGWGTFLQYSSYHLLSYSLPGTASSVLSGAGKLSNIYFKSYWQMIFLFLIAFRHSYLCSRERHGELFLSTIPCCSAGGDEQPYCRFLHWCGRQAVASNSTWRGLQSMS